MYYMSGFECCIKLYDYKQDYYIIALLHVGLTILIIAI